MNVNVAIKMRSALVYRRRTHSKTRQGGTAIVIVPVRQSEPLMNIVVQQHRSGPFHRAIYSIRTNGDKFNINYNLKPDHSMFVLTDRGLLLTRIIIILTLWNGHGFEITYKIHRGHLQF